MAEVIKMPKLGFDMTEGTVINWLKKVGETINKGDVIAEVESDKATLEVEADASGVLLKTLVNAGDVVPVGAPIAELGAQGEAGGAAQPAAQPEQKPQAQPQTAHAGNGASKAPVPVAVADTEGMPGGIKASPLARKMAADKGIDLRQIQGTGPGGRIVKEDVETFQPGKAAAPAAVTPAPRPAAKPMAVPVGDGITEEVPSKIRQRIAARMTESKQTVPHFYVTTEIDMAPALAFRKQINQDLPEDQKITVNDLVVKAVALTLRKFPNLNSHYYGDKVVRHSHINIGIAVAMEGGGLMNVVAKDADVTSISRMAERNKEMIASARAGKVRPEDIEGSTFTVSNLGPYEVESFLAIINPPEAGILAVASARDVPVVINGEIKVGTRMKCTLSVDHRVSDGAEGAQFMQTFKKLLESPMKLLI